MMVILLYNERKEENQMTINFLEIVASLNVIPLSLFWGFLLLFLLSLVIAFVEVDWDKNEFRKKMFVLLHILAATAPYFFMKNFGNQKAKAILKKYNVSSVKNLKRNIKIIRDTTEFYEDKNEYVNRILNKFYVDDKDATYEEKELMKKLKK